MADNKTLKLNISLGIVSQVLTVVINYLTKQAIYSCLGAEYMGIQVVFGNICDLITIAFACIGATMLTRLYTPLSEKDFTRLSALRNHFHHVSKVLTAFSALLGLLASFAAIWLTDSSFAPREILMYYLAYLIGILIYCCFRMDYYYLLANERLYVASLVYGIFDLAAMVVQIGILHLVRNYFLYLLCICLKNLLECVFIRLYINRSYPETNDKSAVLPDDDTKSIRNDLAYLTVSKVGDLLMFSTDSMIISKIISVAMSGLYSNYYFIVNGMQNLIYLIFDNLMARMGNKYANAKSRDKVYGYFYLCCPNLLITSVGVCGLYWMTDSFITLWMGRDALIGHYVVVLSAAELYLQITRRSINVFRVNEGIFREMTPIIVFRGVFNVILSIVLGWFYGLFGIMLATIITDLTTVYVYEPILVLKHLGSKYRYEAAYQAVSLVTVLISLEITGIAIALVPLTGWIGFIVKGCIIVAVAGLFSGAIGWIMNRVICKIQTRSA